MQSKKSTLKVIHLGGVSEIGKNMTALEYGNEIVVIDCGLIFPKDEMLGVDYVIPDITYLLKNKEKVKAFIITHGHEDHIGALPYVMAKLNVPVYATRLTIALIENKLEDRGMRDKVVMNRIEPGDKVDLGVFKIEFIRISHSIAGCVALAIRTPVGLVIHTGDFKIDYTPIDGEVMDLNAFARLGSEGVLALLSDSTNAERPGYTMSERRVGETFESFFKQAKGRIIVATFSSNIHRIQQVIDASARYGRKVCFSGRSMETVSKMAIEHGYLRIDEEMMIVPHQLGRYLDEQITIITTGSQGEPMAGLSRMASDEQTKLDIEPGDLVIISSSPIPGNERMVDNVINKLFKKGANVIYHALAQVHVSGHACQEELKLIITLTKPKYFIPVHGEYRHLRQHSMLAESLGVPGENIFLPEIGTVVEFSKNGARIGGSVPSGSVIIDGSGVGDVGSVVLRDRRLLSQDGLMVVVVTISKSDGRLLAGPDIISRGFVYVRESEELMEEAKDRVRGTLEECSNRNVSEWANLKNEIKKTLRDFLYDQTKRNPMILPIIIELDVDALKKEDDTPKDVF